MYICLIKLTTFATYFFIRNVLLQIMIKIRKADIAELSILMDIFEQGKRIMRKDGNMKQWTGGYPTEEIVRKDIETGTAIYALMRDRTS